MKKGDDEGGFINIGGSTKTVSLENMLANILAGLRLCVPFDQAAVLLLEEERLTVAGLLGDSIQPWKAGDALDRTTFPFFIEELKPLRFATPGAGSAHLAANQWMAMPLLDDKNLIGMLVVIRWGEDVYTDIHSRLAHTFAAQAVLVIANERLIKQVRKGRKRVQTLSKQLVQVQEDQRRFLAHELHDQIGQELTGLQFILQMGKIAPETERLQAFSEAQRTVAELIARLRELSLNLHPALLEDMGLLPALAAHFERWQTQTGIAIQWNTQNMDRRFPAEVEISAFRVVQEALTNIARYAEVKEAWISLTARDGLLVIQVEDNGRGFDMGQLTTREDCFGIYGMQERTNLLGGTFTIQSKPGEGTRITAIFSDGQRTKKQLPKKHSQKGQLLERRQHDRSSRTGR